MVMAIAAGTATAVIITAGPGATIAAGATVIIAITSRVRLSPTIARVKADSSGS